MPPTEKKYTTSKWAGLTNYECESCPFSTTNLEEMETHVFFHRNPTAQGSGDSDQAAAVVDTAGTAPADAAPATAKKGGDS